MTDRIEFSRDVAKMVYDTAVNSMDYNSGSLDHEEVAALRDFAVTLGLDPMTGTPSNFRSQFAHPFQGTPARLRKITAGDYIPLGSKVTVLDGYGLLEVPSSLCEVCARKDSDPVHLGVSATHPDASS